MHGKATIAPCLLMGKQAAESHIPWLGIRQIKVCLSVCVCVCVRVRVCACACVWWGVGLGSEGDRG